MTTVEEWMAKIEFEPLMTGDLECSVCRKRFKLITSMEVLHEVLALGAWRCIRCNDDLSHAIIKAPMTSIGRFTIASIDLDTPLV